MQLKDKNKHYISLNYKHLTKQELLEYCILYKQLWTSGDSTKEVWKDKCQ